ncbi:hypothetical protein Adt_17777 [Abeliophyllum distichum]|uniref:Uncharacterized protein n=1 Tax=Abeliophyllum distichum TaxID=126358 RepID=A0ABD1THG7_9LAMI
MLEGSLCDDNEAFIGMFRTELVVTGRPESGPDAALVKVGIISELIPSSSSMAQIIRKTLQLRGRERQWEGSHVLGQWSREESSSGRMVEGIDDDEVLSPAPLTSVPPMSRSPQQPGVSGGAGGRPVGHHEMEVESGQRTAPVWKCRFFPSEVNEKQLANWHRIYMVPGEIEFFVPGPNDRADDPHLGCVALNQAVLAAGLRLPFPRIVRKFLREWGIAPTQLCPNGYTSHEPTSEFIERARKARAIDESFRSSSAFITEENLAAAWLLSATSSNSQPRQSDKEMKDISVLLKKKEQAGKGKRKAPSEGQPPAARPRTQEEEAPANVPSPARSVEEITMFPTSGEPSSSPVCRPPPPSSQIPPKPSSRIPPTYLGSTPERDEEYLKLCGSIPKPLRDFFRSNSSTRGDIVELPSSARRAISVLGKSWTPDQQKYLDSMETVESIIAASVNTSRTAIQLTSAAEKMGRMLNDIQVMREEGRKVQAELFEEKRLRVLSEDVLLRREGELRKKEDDLTTLSDELEAANKSRADLEHDLEGERKSNAELKAALEKSADKDEVVAEFRSSNAYMAEQEVVYFLTMEELIETIVGKRPDWDVEFLRDELSDLKRKSTLNPPSLEEVDPDQAGAEE